MSRTVYLGTSDFAAAVLRRLAESPAHARRSSSPRPTARAGGAGARCRPRPRRRRASSASSCCRPPTSTSPTRRARSAPSKPEVVVVCAFGQLIREPLLSELLMLNVHPSLLPRWRGAAPIERAIMAGDEETGVSVMRVTAGLDSGPVALQERVPIEPEEDFGSLSARLAEVGAELLVRALDLRDGGRARVGRAVRRRSHLRGEDRGRTIAASIPHSRRRSWSGGCGP